jgi:threonine dehydrogenase-like Zn-dependent dehydrogenase
MTAMRAAVLLAPGKLVLREAARPTPGPGQVRVRLEGCGLCADDLPLWEGRPWCAYPLAPGAPGREGWGFVDAVGAGVRGLSGGERVTYAGARGFAEYEVVAADAVVRLPAQLEGAPAPGATLGRAVNILRRCALEPRQTVVVVGVGYLGALLIGLLARHGADVVAVARRPAALEVARRVGAALVLPFERESAGAAVRARTGGEGAPCVVEATGAPEALDLAAELCATRGRLVIAGTHADGPRHVNMQWNWKGLDVCSVHDREPAVCRAGVQAAIAELTAGGWRPAALITHRVALADLRGAFDLLHTRPDGFLKAIVECGGPQAERTHG